uniref:HDC06306 n=1 Tax=Drosophila melanogaster TaxID=7227 RepID=Q6IGH0_DROME|nr:TPA_inf: HDC06306 [Drosophila melanogaster]
MYLPLFAAVCFAPVFAYFLVRFVFETPEVVARLKKLCVFFSSVSSCIFISLWSRISISIDEQVARVNDPIKLKITRPKLRLRRWLKTTRLAKKKQPQNLPDEHTYYGTTKKSSHRIYRMRSLNCKQVYLASPRFVCCSWLLQVFGRCIVAGAQLHSPHDCVQWPHVASCCTSNTQANLSRKPETQAQTMATATGISAPVFQPFSPIRIGRLCFLPYRLFRCCHNLLLLPLYMLPLLLPLHLWLLLRCCKCCRECCCRGNIRGASCTCYFDQSCGYQFT